MSQTFLGLSNNVLFETHGRADLIFEVSTRGPEDIVIPVSIVVWVDPELNRVITGCDSCHVPLHLLYFSTLEEVSEGDSEEVRDRQTDTNCRGNLEVLLV